MSTPMSVTYPLTDHDRDWPPLPETEHRPLHRALLAALGPLDGRRLLDVGCGVGLFLRAAELRGALVAGTDPAAAHLEVARWALPDADLRVGGLVRQGDALPFDNGAFDVVTATTAGACRAAVLTEAARVVRPGGMVAAGGWVRPAGCWADEFACHLRRLGLLPPATDDTLDGALSLAGLTLRVAGSVYVIATFPTVAAAWAAMLGSELLLRAVRLAGAGRVRAAFAEAVSGAIAQDGVVRLPKAFRYVVATT